MEFEFEKKGYLFKFRKPKWNEGLYMQYKIIGLHENPRGNDGYYCNSKYDPRDNTMDLYGVTIRGINYQAVKLPDNIANKVHELYCNLKEKNYQYELNKDIKYVLNDNTSYGIYNGISEFKISVIANEIKKRLAKDILLISNKNIAKILTKDKEIMDIAVKTYEPYPEDKNWCEEYRRIYKEGVKNKTATGYGIIPNELIKNKIKNIILDKMKEKKMFEEKEKEELANICALAKKTGEKQLLYKWMEECNDPKEECNTDICYKYVLPNGEIEITRQHTW